MRVASRDWAALVVAGCYITACVIAETGPIRVPLQAGIIAAAAAGATRRSPR